MRIYGHGRLSDRFGKAYFPEAGTIIKNIINMTEELEMSSLTEGVETAKQYEYLYAMGCKLYQGYYFSKSVPREDFEKQWFD